jgi:regulator of sigma E protease
MIVAGPLFNFLLAFILLVTMFCYLGVPQNTKIITARQSKIGNFVPALEEGARQLRTETEYQTKSLAKMFKGEVSFKEIGGPVAVFQITKEAVKEGFWMLWSLAIIFNLVPIPSLDGGCLLLLVLEKAFGRSLCPKLQKRIYIAGMSVLILILILSTANDIFRLLSK